MAQPQAAVDLPVLASAHVVCRLFTEDLRIARRIESFVDVSPRWTLARALTDGSLRLIKRVVTLGECFEGQDELTLLRATIKGFHGAAGHGDSALVRWLASPNAIPGVDGRDLINSSSQAGWTALQRAARNGRVDVVQFLLDHNVTVDALNANGCTALHWAVAYGHAAVVKLLLEHGATTKGINKYGRSALYYAAKGGDPTVVSILMDRESDVNATDKYGRTALHVAIENRHLAAAELLVSRGAWPGIRDEEGKTAVGIASDKRLWGLLVAWLANMDHLVETLTDKEVQSMMFRATKAGRLDVLRQLSRQGMPLEVTDSQGRSLLHEAAKGGCADVVTFLLKNGARVDQADHLGTTALLDTVSRGHVNVARLLCQHNANVDAVNHAGRSALHSASRRGFVSIIELLIASDATVDICDENQWTPLHCASYSGHMGAVELLVDVGGGGVNAVTATGKTAVGLAMERGHFAIVAYLEQHGALVEVASASALPRSFFYEAFGVKEGAASKVGTAGRCQDDDNHAPEWLIDPSDVVFDKGEVFSTHGWWLDAPIEIKKVKFANSSTGKAQFVEELMKWSSLNHPHVVKLFGAYHKGDPFFVFERAAHGSLRHYLRLPGKRPREVWDKLYEAALGLQYLHERGIVHGAIRCKSIVVAANGMAKLSSFDAGNDSTLSALSSQWKAPELMVSQCLPSFASDVFSFGMCVIEAVIDNSPWGSGFHPKILDHVTGGGLPDKPKEMSQDQWSVVERMCRYNPHERLSMSDVVRELEPFTYNSRQGVRFSTLDVAADLPFPIDRWADIGEVRMLDSKVSDILERIQDKCLGRDTVRDRMHQDVCQRAEDIYNQLINSESSVSSDMIQQYFKILALALQSANTVQDTSSQMAKLAEARQLGDNVFAIHRDMDVLIDEGGLSRSSALHLHWRERWRNLHNQAESKFAQHVNDLVASIQGSRADTDGEAALSYIRFELSKRYTGSVRPIGSGLQPKADTVQNPAVTSDEDWFIPEYEVNFDEYDDFSRGAFGSVHHGQWLNARVVVKKVSLEHEEAHMLFLNEVKIWFKLYHPHVVQLYGACHVNQPFFVCEFAANGQLDDYLRTHPDQLWRKLREVALALRYLQAKRVVHGDLKCNNILVGADGAAKLTDFGLSSIQSDSVNQEPEGEDGAAARSMPIGAVRWKAPEVLAGGQATFASDMYSFGMCVVEAASGEFPWGMELPDAAVKFHVARLKKLPPRPPKFEDAAWSLVQGMCRHDPRERSTIVEVVEALMGMVKLELR